MKAAVPVGPWRSKAPANSATGERLTPHVVLGTISPQLFRRRSLVRLSSALRRGSGAACYRPGHCLTVMVGACSPARNRAADRSEKRRSVCHGRGSYYDTGCSAAKPPRRLQKWSLKNRAEVGNEEPSAYCRIKRKRNEKDIARKKYVTSREKQSALPLSSNGRARLRLQRSAFAIRRF